MTKDCSVKMTFIGYVVSSGDVLRKTGTLVLTVTDEAGNATAASVEIFLNEVPPVLNVLRAEVNLFG